MRALAPAIKDNPLIHRAWVYGSRVKGTALSASDLDVALELIDDEAVCDWIDRSHVWVGALQEAIGSWPKLHVEVVSFETDERVGPAVRDHGVLIFRRMAER